MPANMIAAKTKSPQSPRINIQPHRNHVAATTAVHSNPQRTPPTNIPHLVCLP